MQGLFRGLRFRLLWNGILVGVVLGVQRFYYLPAQKFFLDVVDDLATAVRAAATTVLPHACPRPTPDPREPLATSLAGGRGLAAGCSGDFQVRRPGGGAQPRPVYELKQKYCRKKKFRGIARSPNS